MLIFDDWENRQSDIILFVDRNFEYGFEAPVIGGKGLGSGNFLDSDESEVNRFDLNRIRPAKVESIKSSAGFKATRKLEPK